MRSFRRRVWPVVVLALIATACTTDRRIGATQPVSGEERKVMPLRHASSAVTPNPAADRFTASVGRVGADVVARMGTSWQPGCPVGLADLRVLAMTFWGFDGVVHRGEIMVHRRYASAITGVFRTLFAARFPIERMELANGYMGNDPPLAQRNNTVGFNCRAPVGGGRAWSEHAYGRAVDINPDLNPYVSRSGRIEPLFGHLHADRTLTTDGMIQPDDLVVGAFRAIGWRWGGSWTGTKDYMHFSATGR